VSRGKSWGEAKRNEDLKDDVQEGLHVEVVEPGAQRLDVFHNAAQTFEHLFGIILRRVNERIDGNQGRK
jgi:delta-aminolevulinic acid dehydratase/porphobilinogen synthase